MQYGMEELVPIVAELAKGYTSGESSSVSYEKAEQLMQAVQYTIHELEQESASRAVSAPVTARQAYDAGYQLLCDKVRRCQAAYNQMIPEFDAYGNEFYYDTVVKGLPKFFLYYDARYNPQDHLLTLDYVTRDFDPQLTGIDQIEDYLLGTVQEQRYLKKFPRSQVIAALEQWNSDYRELPVNVAQLMQDVTEQRDTDAAGGRRDDGAE
jgi:hypothetical protein